MTSKWFTFKDPYMRLTIIFVLLGPFALLARDVALFVNVVHTHGVKYHGMARLASKVQSGPRIIFKRSLFRKAAVMQNMSPKELFGFQGIKYKSNPQLYYHSGLSVNCVVSVVFWSWHSGSTIAQESCYEKGTFFRKENRVENYTVRVNQLCVPTWKFSFQCDVPGPTVSFLNIWILFFRMWSQEEQHLEMHILFALL